MYQRILVPVDNSTSHAELKEAARFAQMCPTALIRVIHVIDLEETITDETEVARQPSTLRQRGQDNLERVMEAAKELGFTPESALVEAFGTPLADVVVEYAKTWSAELIIMGTHGYSGLNHLLLGSVAEGVVRHAAVPVLLVRTPA